MQTLMCPYHLITNLCFMLLHTRSQLGNRDSEIAMIIEDTDMVDAYMDGKKVR